MGIHCLCRFCQVSRSSQILSALRHKSQEPAAANARTPSPAQEENCGGPALPVCSSEQRLPQPRTRARSIGGSRVSPSPLMSQWLRMSTGHGAASDTRSVNPASQPSSFPWCRGSSSSCSAGIQCRAVSAGLISSVLHRICLLIPAAAALQGQAARAAEPSPGRTATLHTAAPQKGTRNKWGSDIPKAAAGEALGRTH